MAQKIGCHPPTIRTVKENFTPKIEKVFLHFHWSHRFFTRNIKQARDGIFICASSYQSETETDRDRLINRQKRKETDINKTETEIITDGNKTETLQKQAETGRNKQKQAETENLLKFEQACVLFADV